jgi:hypothetical protein
VVNHHWAFAIRLGALGGLGIAVIGIADHYWKFPLLTAALGPTIYVLVAHPDTEAAQVRNAVVGHAAGIGSGLLALAAFGLWDAPSVNQIGHSSLSQAGANGLAIALTLISLHVFKAHHAPAAATTVLIATGLARPGVPLYGLIVGLAAILTLAIVLNGILPVRPNDRSEED